MIEWQWPVFPRREECNEFCATEVSDPAQPLPTGNWRAEDLGQGQGVSKFQIQQERLTMIVLTGFLIGLRFIVIVPDYLHFTLLGPTSQPFPRIFPQMVIPSKRNILETLKSIMKTNCFSR